MKVTLFRDLPTEGWSSMERYADELAAALLNLGCDARSFVIGRPLPRLGGTLGTLANYAWRSTVYPLAARSRQRDINHIIDHSYAHLIGALDASRTVVTCHDIAPLELDQRGHGLSRRLWDRSFHAMLHAAHIIADSAHTRDAILRHADYPADRIAIVPLAVDGTFFDAIDASDLDALRQRYQLAGRRVLLHVGSCQPRKNVEAIFEALAQVHDLNAVLVQIGGRFSTGQEQHIAHRGLAARVTQIELVSERELCVWYQASDALVLPSIYEGFGLPVLEAMASGTPVICSNATSLPEVTGDTAILIDPQDPLTLAGAIRSVLSDTGLAADLRRRGLERSKSFTWDRTARETLAVYECVYSHFRS